MIMLITAMIIMFAVSVLFIASLSYIGSSVPSDSSDGLLKQWTIYSGTISATVKADNEENAITNFLMTVSNMDDVGLAEQIGIFESGKTIDEAKYLLTAKEVGRRHLVPNNILYEYINGEDIAIDDDWYKVLKSNAAFYKKNKPVAGDGTMTWGDTTEDDPEVNF